jgi:hypothetical protein
MATPLEIAFRYQKTHRAPQSTLVWWAKDQYDLLNKEKVEAGRGTQTRKRYWGSCMKASPEIAGAHLRRLSDL